MKIFYFLKKEFLSLKRNKKQIGVIIALPLAFALIYSLMFSASSVDISVSICNLDKGDFGRQFYESLSESFEAKYYLADSNDECFNIIKEDLALGTTFGIKIPDDFTQKLMEYSSPNLELFIDNSKPNLGFFAQSALFSSMEGFKSSVIASAQASLRESANEIRSDLDGTLNALELIEPSLPLISKPYYDSLYSNFESYRESAQELEGFNLQFVSSPVNARMLGIFEGKNNKGFSFSILYIVLSALVLVLLAGMGIVSDKKSGLIIRLRTGFGNLGPYILSKMIFYSLLGFLVFIVPFAVFIIDGAYFSINYFSLILAIILSSCAWALIGCIIGFSSKDESSAIMVSVFVGFLALLLSGLFYPLEFLPKAVRVLTLALPSALHSSMLNNALVFNSSIESMGNIFLNNAIYCGVLLLICAYLLLKPIKD